MREREVTVGYVKAALRRAGHREARVHRRKGVQAPGFWVVEWPHRKYRPITVYYRSPASQALSVDGLIQIMEGYQRVLHATPRRFYAGLHVGFPCSVGGVHLCIERAERTSGR